MEQELTLLVKADPEPGHWLPGALLDFAIVDTLPKILPKGVAPPGGWGAVWVENGEIRAELHGHDPDTTNNRMELTALLEAFKALPEDAEVTVHSDSRLCVDTITKWAPNWERNGWKRKGDPLKNLDLVKPLLTLYRAHPRCRLEWIEAHSGHRWNEYADALATAWMRSET